MTVLTFLRKTPEESLEYSRVYENGTERGAAEEQRRSIKGTTPQRHLIPG